MGFNIQSKMSKNAKSVSTSITEAYNKASAAKQKLEEKEDEIESNESVIENDLTTEETVESEVTQVEIDEMTKDELEDYARNEFNIELDKRKKKSELIEIVKDALNK